MLVLVMVQGKTLIQAQPNFALLQVLVEHTPTD